MREASCLQSASKRTENNLQHEALFVCAALLAAL
jgi:hypothetical protein